VYLGTTRKSFLAHRERGTNTYYYTIAVCMRVYVCARLEPQPYPD